MLFNFYTMWSLFLKLFGSDLGLSLLILLKSHTCFSSTKLHVQPLHLVI